MVYVQPAPERDRLANSDWVRSCGMSTPNKNRLVVKIVGLNSHGCE